MLTQEQIRSDLAYNPVTGEFAWKKSGKGRKVGKRPGRISKYGYHEIKLSGKIYFAHKLAWLYVHGHYPQHPQEQIDHVNRDRSDNRIENLRLVKQGENDKNRSRYKNAKGPLTGVHWDAERKKWRADICSGDKRYNLGRYDSLFEAAAVRKSAELAHSFAANHGA